MQADNQLSENIGNLGLWTEPGIPTTSKSDTAVSRPPGQSNITHYTSPRLCVAQP